MRTVVMTGGTSGLGAVAAQRLTREGGVRLLLGARRETAGAETSPLHLDQLASVREFADAVHRWLDGAALDGLVLNAGTLRADADGRTVDGVETTFAVNHLAHHLLLRLLLPALSTRAVAVLTTSGTHDPATGAGLPPPRHADAGLLAHPERDPGRERSPRRAGQHAYTASKLCALLTVRRLTHLPGGPPTAIAFCPGQVFGTGLAGQLPLRSRVAWSVLGHPLLRRPLRRLEPALNGAEEAGAALADLTLGRLTPPPGRCYAALRSGVLSWPDPSAPARDDQLAQALWDDSDRLVGYRS
ncbi:SDR family NAD(P)-dependent oxidoreductase [Desertihabitans aurantiacus]|uniref:SDR family NAD(P)-dependent oxidoreductase n=1 Tax=Desertihabitans aurantiacus TaxID=2282477 RepID=UPI000DF82D58|nr:SDR family NAD(P)-dependent oxidoreductase [Desertihabitans aurantiacus]